MKHLNWGGGVGGGQEAAADELTDRGKQQLRRRRFGIPHPGVCSY